MGGKHAGPSITLVGNSRVWSGREVKAGRRWDVITSMLGNCTQVYVEKYIMFKPNSNLNVIELHMHVTDSRLNPGINTQRQCYALT